MKKFAFLLTLLLVLCLCMAAAEKPTEYTSGDYKYIVLEDGTAEITDYTGKAHVLTIPSELNGLKVTSIGYRAFCDYPSLTDMINPNYVNSTLISITIPNSVTNIGDMAFFYCDSLTSITIPNSVTSIGMNPFGRCSNLTAILISADHPTLATIDGVLFEKTEKRLVCYPCTLTAKQYSIPQGISIIGAWAFDCCDSLTCITIPDSVTVIGDSAFYKCSSLTSIAIPNSVTVIGNRAFDSCESLANITIPSSVISIGDEAFYSCDSLASVTISDSVTSIGGGAFSNCNAAFTLTVPRNSYARQYAIDNNLNYTYPDANDWLLN